MSRSVYLAVLGADQQDDHSPLHHSVQREIKLLSPQLHFRKEDPGPERVRVRLDFGAC